MKTIGLLGGMSWESSALYYSIINKEVRKHLGKSHSARCILYSFDFQELEELLFAGRWDLLKEKLYEAGEILKKAPVDFIILCTNTMHKVMDTFEDDLGIPFLHLVDVIGEAAQKDGLKKVGLLGTRFTMEDGFYKERIKKNFGIEVVTPGQTERDEIHRIIFEELVRGKVVESSQKTYYEVMDRLTGKGCEGIILGCTEIGILVKEYKTKLYDTTILHAKKAAELSLAD